MDEFEELSLDEDSSDEENRHITKLNLAKNTNTNKADSCKHPRNASGCKVKTHNVTPNTRENEYFLIITKNPKQRSTSILQARQSYINYLTFVGKIIAHTRVTDTTTDPMFHLLSGQIYNIHSVIATGWREADMRMTMNEQLAKMFIPFMRTAFPSQRREGKSNPCLSYELPEFDISDVKYVKAKRNIEIFRLVKDILNLEEKFNNSPQTNVTVGLTEDGPRDILTCGSTLDGLLQNGYQKNIFVKKKLILCMKLLVFQNTV
jgi:hypothetical protein